MTPKSQAISDYELGGFVFKNPELLLQALTHSSYSAEAPQSVNDNERLEFLGDAVLGLVVARNTFLSYPELKEGQLAKLRAAVVSERALARLARTISLGPRLRLGKGEIASKGWDKDSILADALEAVIGAAFLDGGLDECEKWLWSLVRPAVQAHLIDGGGLVAEDSKNSLQQIAQSEGLQVKYHCESSGLQHQLIFSCQLFINNELRAQAEGRSKKEAEMAAATKALNTLKTQREP